MSQQTTYPGKVANACAYCRGRKVKCTGESRCKNCFDHNKECIYPPSQRKRARRATDDETSMLGQRLRQVEALLQGSNAREMSAHLFNPVLNEHVPQQPLMEYQSRNQPTSELSPEQHNPSPSSNNTTGILEHAAPDTAFTVSESAQSLNSTNPRSSLYTPPSTVTEVSAVMCGRLQTSEGGNLNRESPRVPMDNEEGIVPPENVNWEHHGPGSWLSICSSPGVKWVCERTGALDFGESAKGLSMGWTKRLKLQRSMNRERAPELDVETAWKYSNAFFEECHYAVFGIVERSTFEARLQLQHSQQANYEDDVCWSALRNTIFASGCRIVLSKDPSITFAEAQAQAWRYFENALSVHTDLLYTPTGLVAVEALTLMGFYAEGLGSPALEYMLSSSAVRLAQSKGLHRQPAKTWNVPESEVLHRNWLFWAIYCCEKAIINRSGRPSAIDDDDISCQIPTETPPNSSIDIDMFTYAIKHAQIASLISKKLASVSAFRSTTAEILETVRSLDRKLQEWRDQLPHGLQINSPTKALDTCGSRNMVSVYHLHFAYYGSLMAIHMVLVYPWIAAIFSIDQVQAFRDQVSVSSETVDQAARSIILLTRHLHIDAASPAWLAFYYPMVGLINLFISILKSPASATSQSDVALMDVAAGHFAHMEFITSAELAFPFTREAADLARQTVKRARQQKHIDVSGAAWSDGVWTNADAEYWNELHAMAAVGLDMEGWNVFTEVSMHDSLDGNDIHYPQG